MMYHRTLKMLVAAALLAGTAAVSAQDLKIGYVNSDRVLRDALPAKAADIITKESFIRTLSRSGIEVAGFYRRVACAPADHN